MRNETIEIDDRYGKDYVGRYVFQEITWAKRSRIIQKHTHYHPATGQIADSDFVTIQAETIWASLKEQPEHRPITFEKLVAEENGIPIELGEAFSRIVNKLCGVAPVEQRFLSAPSDEANHTQCSQRSGCARNSGGPLTSLQSSQPKPSRNSS